MIRDEEARYGPHLWSKMRRLRADVVRADGRLERTCVHGIGHPVGHIRAKHFDAVHGCDGCCEAWRR